MSLLVRRRYPEASYETWKDVFAPYLSGLYDLMVGRLTAGGGLSPLPREAYETFCAFVYQFSSKEIPDIFFKELDESLDRDSPVTAITPKRPG